MENKEIQFLPFHAINEFMLPEFRLKVIKTTLNSLATLPEKYRRPIDRLTTVFVKVPGFRNSTKAPAGVKVRPLSDAFEKNPALVAAIISAWAYLQPELMQHTYDLLVSRKWDILPMEADRSGLPGFLIKWPAGENFEILFQAYKDTYPDKEAISDDVSLMCVWLGNRLPYPEKTNTEPQDSDN